MGEDLDVILEKIEDGEKRMLKNIENKLDSFRLDVINMIDTHLQSFQMHFDTVVKELNDKIDDQSSILRKHDKILEKHNKKLEEHSESISGIQSDMSDIKKKMNENSNGELMKSFKKIYKRLKWFALIVFGANILTIIIIEAIKSFH